MAFTSAGPFPIAPVVPPDRSGGFFANLGNQDHNQGILLALLQMMQQNQVNNRQAQIDQNRFELEKRLAESGIKSQERGVLSEEANRFTTTYQVRSERKAKDALERMATQTAKDAEVLEREGYGSVQPLVRTLPAFNKTSPSLADAQTAVQRLTDAVRGQVETTDNPIKLVGIANAYQEAVSRLPPSYLGDDKISANLQQLTPFLSQYPSAAKEGLVREWTTRKYNRFESERAAIGEQVGNELNALRVQDPNAFSSGASAAIQRGLSRPIRVDDVSISDLRMPNERLIAPKPDVSTPGAVVGGAQAVGRGLQSGLGLLGGTNPQGVPLITSFLDALGASRYQTVEEPISPYNKEEQKIQEAANSINWLR